MAQYRNWKEFLKYAVNSLKRVYAGMILVPIFYVLINPDYKDPDFFRNILMALRIGIEIGTFHWMMSTIIYSIIYHKNPSTLLQLKKSMPFQFILGITVMLFCLGLATVLEPWISGNSFGLRGITMGLLIGGCTFLFVLLYVAYRETQAHYLALKAETMESQLNVLKNQMQPHFLFNSLNSLAELIDSQQSSASEMTLKLSDLYREILETSKQKLSPLSKELSIIQNYLEFEQIRFGQRLRLNLDLQVQSPDTILLPSLLLQTLIENAIKHGLSPQIDGGYLQILIQEHSDFVVFQLQNSIPKDFELNPESTGLTNSKQRLDLIYPGQHHFQIRFQSSMAQVNFQIPKGSNQCTKSL